ncbi:MAG: DNA polymerase/3'-5' exonuclease PolX [Nanoarchaeota archaeon]|nr:DNA polymerase/3'-5' exonuclease PolX [Nanoarchaeota archaeon]
MINQEISKIFYEIAEIYNLKNVQWKPMAYNKAARVIENLPDDLKAIYKKEGLKGLDAIPGIGKSMSKKIEEYIKTGKIKKYIELKKSIPKGLVKLMEIQGIGPKKASKLYKKLRIENLKDLEKAIRKGKVKNLEGFGSKSEEDIQESVKLFKERKNNKRYLLGEILPMAEELISKLKKLSDTRHAIACGSIRRMYETIGDVDILATGSYKIVDEFCNFDDVKKILAKGSTKASVILKNNLQVDLRVVKDDVFGSALQYFTGSKDHGIKLRRIAMKKGYKLSEYGLFKRNKIIVCRNEESIYNRLGMQYIPPELRENTNEIEMAIKHKIPKLIEYNAIKGDLHMHTKASDGNNTIKEMAEAAKKLNYNYIAITEHSKGRGIANGLSEKNLMKHINEIKKTKVNGLKILSGSEVDIKADGSLDYKDNILKKLDIVIASIHSGFSQSKEKITNRVINAIENENVDVIGHLTGRLINRREPYKINLDEVFKAAKKNNKLIEINSQPDRLDLRDVHIREAIENGVKLVINTDAHSVDSLRLIKLGIGQARRGWAKKSDIINTKSYEEFKKYL